MKTLQNKAPRRWRRLSSSICWIALQCFFLALLCVIWSSVNELTARPTNSLTPRIRVKKFLAFYRTPRFIAALTTDRHLSLYWAISVHCTSFQQNFYKPFYIILFSDLHPGLSSGLFPSSSLPEQYISLNHACYIRRPHHSTWFDHSFIQYSVLLTTGPKPLPKRFLHTVRSRASYFKWEYPVLSLRSSSSFLHLLPRLLVTSISPFIFPSTAHPKKKYIFLRVKFMKVWITQFAQHMFWNTLFYVSPLVWETKFHTHIKQQSKIIVLPMI
jgi:hypothetical protein